jgi:hypothetical protein
MSEGSALTGDIVPVLAPVTAVLTGLADASEVLAGSGMAMADSQAMAELSNEAAIAGPGFDEPVHAAHSNAGMLRFASTDAVRQFARLFGSQPVPVYSHLAVARAGLESAAHAYWAAVQGIGPVARVQRLQMIRLRNCREMKRSPIPEYKAHGKTVMIQIREQCRQRAWHAVANKQHIVVGDQEMPGSGAMIKTLLAAGSSSPELERLGATAWWFQSGISHGVNFALIESIEANEQTSTVGPQLAQIYTSSRSVAQQAFIVGLGYLSMIQEHRRLFGWKHDAWDEAARAFIDETRSRDKCRAEWDTLRGLTCGYTRHPRELVHRPLIYSSLLTAPTNIPE